MVVHVKMTDIPVALDVRIVGSQGRLNAVVGTDIAVEGDKVYHLAPCTRCTESSVCNPA